MTSWWMLYKYIYIPIQESFEHWYLCVVCFANKKIYHLDSHLKPRNVIPRNETIRNLVGSFYRNAIFSFFVSQVVTISWYKCHCVDSHLVYQLLWRLSMITTHSMSLYRHLTNWTLSKPGEFPTVAKGNDNVPYNI